MAVPGTATWKWRRRALVLVLLGLSLAAWQWHSRKQVQAAFGNGLTALRTGDADQVEAAIKLLEGRPERDSQIHVLRAGLLMSRQSWFAALEELTQVAPVGEVRHPALEMAGECLYRIGHIVQAEAMMRQLASEDPDNITAHRCLGAIYYDLGANYQSINELERVAELDPGDFTSLRLIGLMHMDFEQYPLAIEHYRKALDRNPTPGVKQEVLLELGKCLMAELQYSEAIEVLRQCDSSAIACARISECFWSTGDHDQAQDWLDEARRLDAEDRSVLFMQARIDLHAGRLDSAEQALQAIIRNDPADKEAHYQLALVYQGLGNRERQQTIMSRWQELEALYQRLSDLSEDAIANPADAGLRDQLADTCALLGKHEIAAAWRRVAQVLRASAPATEGEGPQSHSVPGVPALFTNRTNPTGAAIVASPDAIDPAPH